MNTHIAFLSHQSSDKKLARAVGQYLAANNIQPILDEWTFRRGMSLAQEIEENISRSTCFIMFWSSSAFASSYVQFEDEMAVARRTKDRLYQTQIVRLDKTPLPQRHSFLIYHDWRRGKPGSKLFAHHIDLLRRAILGLPDVDPPSVANINSEISSLLEAEVSARSNLNIAWQELNNWMWHSPDARDQIELFEDDIRKYVRQLREICTRLRNLGYSDLN